MNHLARAPESLQERGEGEIRLLHRLECDSGPEELPTTVRGHLSKKGLSSGVAPDKHRVDFQPGEWEIEISKMLFSIHPKLNSGYLDEYQILNHLLIPHKIELIKLLRLD